MWAQKALTEAYRGVRTKLTTCWRQKVIVRAKSTQAPGSLSCREDRDVDNDALQAMTELFMREPVFKASNIATYVD